MAYIHVCPVFKLDVLVTNIVEENKRKPKEQQKNSKNLKEDAESFLREMTQYKPKYYFLLFPDSEFGNKPAFADLGRVFGVPIEWKETIISKRILSLKNSWREKLGYKIGYLYNRIATKEIEPKSLVDYLDEDMILGSIDLSQKRPRFESRT